MVRFSQVWSLEFRNSRARTLTSLIEVSLNDGGEPAHEIGRGSTGAVAVVAVIAHLQLLSDEDLQVDLATDLQSFLDDRIELIAQPVQTGDNGIIISTETQNLAQTLIEGAVSHVAMSLIDDLQTGME